MADVRQLLRAERNSRRITHPHASYTGDGKLLCNLCDTFVKSEAQWQSHLHSTGHNLRSQRKKDVEETRGSGGLKRKVEEPGAELESRKRSRAVDEETEKEGRQSEMTERSRPAKSVKFSEDVVVKIDEGAQPPANGDALSPPPEPQPKLPPPQKQQEATIDESEFQAFEREIATLSKSHPTSALQSEATISAAPLTAQALASQASAEQSTQRGKRDAELEDEKEDAARVLEDEFEEMRGYEDRIRRLRERREELRRGSSGGDEEDGGGGVDGGGQLENGLTVESDDEDDEDFEDDWGFGGVG